MKHSLFSLSVFLLCSADLLATRIYVDAAATAGARNGSSWTNAYTRLDSALQNSFSGDSIWVKAGRYVPVGSKTSAYFNMPSGRKLFGGFSGTENTVNDRNLSNNKSYLDGDIGTKGQASDNSMNVMRVSNAGAGTEVNGFHVVNGYAYSAGGGITIGGGGLRVIGGQLTLNNCSFEDNYSYMRGAGVYTENSAVVYFNNCSFSNNSTGNDVNSLGGALYSNSGTCYFYDCSLTGNSSQRGGALALNGGAQIHRCSLSGNRSNNGGGGAIYVMDNGWITMYNSLLAGNTASSTSIIYMSGTFNTNTHYVVNCTFAGNKVAGSNSTILQDNSTTYVRNCIFWNNSSQTQIYYFPTAVEPVVSNCIVAGGYNYGNKISIKNPQFASPGDPQNAPFDASLYNYALKAGSAAVDAGDSNFLQTQHKTDLLRSPRIRGNNADLGALESGFSAWTITLSGAGSSGGGVYPHDSTVTVKASAPACSVFYRWSEADTTLSTDSIYSFAATGHRNLKAEYKTRLYNIGGVAQTPGSGSVGNSGVYRCSDSTFTLVAVPAKCYRFKEWRENSTVVGTSAFYNFTPKRNISLVAVFEPITYNISLNVSPAQSGTVTGAGTYACDSLYTVRARAKAGYRFLRWDEFGQPASTDSVWTIRAAANRLLTAVFQSTASVNSLNSQALIFPNPVKEVLHITLPDAAEGTYSLYTTQGVLLRKGSLTASQTEIDVRDLPSGVFILHLSTNQHSERVVVVKE